MFHVVASSPFTIKRQDDVHDGRFELAKDIGVVKVNPPQPVSSSTSILFELDTPHSYFECFSVSEVKKGDILESGTESFKVEFVRRRTLGTFIPKSVWHIILTRLDI